MNSIIDVERARDIENILVTYPLQLAILLDIEQCRKFAPISSEVQGRLIMGDAGAGKTTIYEIYQSNHPRRDEEHGTVVPVLAAVIPAQASVKALVTKLLRKLGDPICDKGNIEQQTARLETLLKACKTEIIILDEFQHFIERDSSLVMQATADWLKVLINETRIPIILIGMLSCAQILDGLGNEQLRRRFPVRHTIEPLRWDNRKGKNEMRLFLAAIEKQLPLHKRSNLSGLETAYRIHCATLGNLSSIMKLIRGAAHMAVSSGIEQITLEMLATVYDAQLAINRPDFPNPFRTGIEKIEAALEAEASTAAHRDSQATRRKRRKIRAH